jgi:hypothetical protein
MMSVALFYCYAECRYAECHFAECRYAECSSTLKIAKSSEDTGAKTSFRRFLGNNKAASGFE